jgi:hypothetical protein
MTVESVAQIKFIPATAIVSRVMARSVKPDGVDRLRGKIERLGFQADKPLRVYPVDGGYRLIDGNHRLEAAIRLALATVPALVVDPPEDELAEIQQARESNEASETVVKTTFIDDAELVWKLTETFTQEQTAKAMGGWKQQRIAQYKALKKISEDAWEIITTSFSDSVVSDDDSDVVSDTTTVVKQKFTEGLLREILDLDAGQQVELCGYLAKGKDKKGHAYNKAKFKQDAIWYRGFNVLWELVDASLLEFSDEYAPLSPIQEPKWRVKSLLMKLDSDEKNGTDYFRNKFVPKVEEIFAGLPKPKDWQSFQKHDLPLLFTANEVQQFALEHKLNKSQTKAVDALQKAAHGGNS